MKTVKLITGEDTPECDILLVPGKNLINGTKHFVDTFGGVSSLEEDVLNLGAAIFAADLGVKRGRCEDFTRKIHLEVEVVNLKHFENIVDDLKYALFVLSNDAWDISFKQRSGVPEAAKSPDEPKEGKVLLFSGGLDSLAAAVMFGMDGNETTLVSHVTNNRVVSGAQNAVRDALHSEFPNLFHHHQFKIGARTHRDYPFPRDQDREETQRTRSIVFLTLAALTARRKGINEVVVIAENGQMAIHLPLTAARISAFSTHTAHPEYVELIQNIFSRLLGFEMKFVNPFLYDTKLQVVEPLKAYAHLVECSISCWKASRVRGEKHHCGFCVPCLIRRIACEGNGISLDEYQRDILNEDIASLEHDDDGKRNLMELCEFIQSFGAQHANENLLRNYPELMNPQIDTDEAIQMYRRFSIEANEVFASYPKVKELMT